MQNNCIFLAVLRRLVFGGYFVVRSTWLATAPDTGWNSQGNVLNIRPGFQFGFNCFFSYLHGHSLPCCTFQFWLVPVRKFAGKVVSFQWHALYNCKLGLLYITIQCSTICSRIFCHYERFVSCGVGLLFFSALLIVLACHSPVCLPVCLSVCLFDCLFVYFLYGPCCLIQINEWMNIKLVTCHM